MTQAATKQAPEERISTYERRMSPWQYAFMRDLIKGKISGNEESIRRIHNGVVRTCEKREFIEVKKIDGENFFVPTSFGLQGIEMYQRMPPPARDSSRDLSDTVMIMLGLSRKRNGNGKGH